jgi:hypothetical protein
LTSRVSSVCASRIARRFARRTAATKRRPEREQSNRRLWRIAVCNGVRLDLNGNGGWRHRRDPANSVLSDGCRKDPSTDSRRYLSIENSGIARRDHSLRGGLAASWLRDQGCRRGRQRTAMPSNGGPRDPLAHRLQDWPEVAAVAFALMFISALIVSMIDAFVGRAVWW